MIVNFMADKLIVSFEEYIKIVEKLAIQIHKQYKPTVLVGIMRGAAPILDILSRILKLPIAYIVIQSYSGKGMEDQQGQLMFAREISSLAENKDFQRVLLIDDLSDTGLTLNKRIEGLKKYPRTKDFIEEVKTEPRVEGPVNEGDSFETGDDEEGINPAVTLRESSSGLRGGNKRVMTCDLANVSLAAPKTSSKGLFYRVNTKKRIFYFGRP